MLNWGVMSAGGIAYVFCNARGYLPSPPDKGDLGGWLNSCIVSPCGCLL